MKSVESDIFFSPAVITGRVSRTPVLAALEDFNSVEAAIRRSARPDVEIPKRYNIAPVEHLVANQNDVPGKMDLLPTESVLFCIFVHDLPNRLTHQTMELLELLNRFLNRRLWVLDIEGD